MVRLTMVHWPTLLAIYEAWSLELISLRLRQNKTLLTLFEFKLELYTYVVCYVDVFIWKETKRQIWCI